MSTISFSRDFFLIDRSLLTGLVSSRSLIRRYGGSFLLSKNLAVPMVAHALSNLTSAVIWKNKKGEKE